LRYDTYCLFFPQKSELAILARVQRAFGGRKATMSVTKVLEGLIISRPDIHRGRPVIAGTGVAVRTVVGHYKLGLTPEQVADEMSLPLAGVYAALTYFHLNREEIEKDEVANSEAALMLELSSE
jgi:uncharacterized protein (DUF433 family)